MQDVVMNQKVEKKNFIEKVKGDSQLVVALVLIAVAVGLCIIFRNTLYNIMTNLFTTIGTQINALSNGTVTGT